MTLGQEFGGYAANVAHAAKELERSAQQLLELNLGIHRGRHRAERRQRFHRARHPQPGRRTQAWRCGRP